MTLVECTVGCNIERSGVSVEAWGGVLSLNTATDPTAHCCNTVPANRKVNAIQNDDRPRSGSRRTQKADGLNCHYHTSHAYVS
jgi:hypothetical protein